MSTPDDPAETPDPYAGPDGETARAGMATLLANAALMSWDCADCPGVVRVEFLHHTRQWSIAVEHSSTCPNQRGELSHG